MALRKSCLPALLAVAAFVPAPARALEPSWQYVDYSRVWGHAQPNEPTEGSALRFSWPVHESIFFSAYGERLDGEYKPPENDRTERFELASAGVGMYRAEGNAHFYALASYVDKRRAQYTPAGETGDHYAGAGLSLGARWLVTPYLSVEPQYGLKGYILDGFTRLDVALRLLPRLWLTGTFDHGPFSSNEYCAGLRWAWSDYTYGPSHFPGARVSEAAPPSSGAAPGPGETLAAGETLVAVRPLVPQVRPAAGAPELQAIPPGAPFVLEESTQNDFGTWWRVLVDGQSAWIRETDLKGRPEGT